MGSLPDKRPPREPSVKRERRGPPKGSERGRPPTKAKGTGKTKGTGKAKGPGKAKGSERGRSPGKSPPKGPRVSPRPARIDPQTVEAMGRVVDTCLRGLERGGELGIAAARWLGPRLLAGGLASLTALGRGVAASARWIWTQRSVLTRIGHRGLWWGALAILMFVGQALLGADGDPELVALSMGYLIAGLSMSVIVLLGAPETRMRVAALALAGGHGSLAALVFVVI